MLHEVEYYFPYLARRLNSKIEALDFDVETAAEEELFVNNEVGGDMRRPVLSMHPGHS